MTVLGAEHLRSPGDQTVGEAREVSRAVRDRALGACAQPLHAPAEALAGPVDRGMGATGDAAAALDERRLGAVHRGAGRRTNRGERLLDGGHVGPDVVDQRRRARGRRLQRGVRHLIGDAAVDLVAQAGEHGHRGSDDRPRDHLGVEGGELVARPSAADEHDRIEAVPARVVPQRRHRPAHEPRRVRSLDPRSGKDDAEPEAAALQLIVEVVPGSGSRAGDDPEAQRHRPQPVAAVGVE
jgi:hypothetical protein